MAYSESALTTEWIPQVRFADGANVNLRTVREAIEREAEENGIPVAFREDQLKTGGIFNRQVEDVLTMYNPEHEYDYLRFVIRIQHMGKYAFMHVYNMGGSKNYSAVNTANYDGDGIASKGFAKIAKLGNMLGGRNAKLQVEEQYYQILADVLANCCGV